MASEARSESGAGIHRVITDGPSSILDYGRATRTIPPAVYTSLLLRDLGCRFPGCDRPGEWCEGHHVVHWEDGGPTCMSNLVLLCSRHHHRVHLPGWHLKLLPTAIAWILVDLGSTTGQMGTTAAMRDTTGDDDQRIDDLDKTIDDARKQAEDHGTIPDSDPDPTFVDPDGDGDPD